MGSITRREEGREVHGGERAVDTMPRKRAGGGVS
jgi:hypothetical protein